MWKNQPNSRELRFGARQQKTMVQRAVFRLLFAHWSSLQQAANDEFPVEFRLTGAIL
jgi:hypothetical protein